MKITRTYGIIFVLAVLAVGVMVAQQQYGIEFSKFFAAELTPTPTYPPPVPHVGVTVKCFEDHVPYPVPPHASPCWVTTLSQPFYITWTSEGADQCAASWKGAGRVGTTGTVQAGPISSDSTYTVTCTGPGGKASGTVAVNTIKPLVCSPSIQAVASGGVANFVTAGGNGTFAWYAAAGVPLLGTQPTFSSRFVNPTGTVMITHVNVTSGLQTASCTVRVYGAQP